MDIREGYVICSHQMKEKLLKNMEGFHNYIFLTMSELFLKLSFQPVPKSTFKIMEKYGFSYDLANEYVNAIPYIEDKFYHHAKLDSIVSVLHYLKEEGLLINNDLFHIRLRQFPVTFINPLKSHFYNNLKKRLEKETIVYEYHMDSLGLQPTVYEFPTLLEEGLFVFNEIKELLLNGISLNHIYIVNANPDSIHLYKRLARSYQVSVAFEPSKDIRGAGIVKEFHNYCFSETSFEAILNKINSQDELYSTIVKTINHYDLIDENPMSCVEFLNKIWEATSYPQPQWVEAIRFASPDFIFNDEDYVFLVGFNLGDAPKIVREEGFLSDELLERLGGLTSYEKNEQSYELFKQLIYNTRHLEVTYKKMSQQDTFLPSLLIDQLNLKVVQKEVSLGYAKLEDELRLSSYYDQFLKYGTMNPILKQYGLNKIPYHSYDHIFKGISQEDLSCRFSKKPLKLAYSNLKLYYSCPFSYFADRILELNEFQPQMAARLGTFSHAVLEDSYEEHFSFSDSVSKHKSENALDAKDEFFFSEMETVLRSLIAFNHDHEAQSRLNIVKREEHIKILKENYQFEGYIDKLMYSIDGEHAYAAIIDYKTGKDVISLDNIEDGFHLQLPAYMYLLSQYEPFKGLQLHIIGIYLQKVNIIIFDAKSDIEKQRNNAFRLEGYTVGDISLIPYLDPDFAHSTYIKSLSLTKEGFHKNAKLYSVKQQEKMIQLVDDLIKTAAQSIRQGKYPIAPKMIKGKNESCQYCKYKDLCFYDYRDIKDLSYKPFVKEVDA